MCFRQTLPVITKKRLKSSSLWHSIQTLNLRTNIRAHLRNNKNNNFPEKLPKLAEGKLHSSNANSSQVLLDNGFGQFVHNLKTLKDTVYPRNKSYM